MTELMRQIRAMLDDRGGPPATGEYLFYLYENLTQAHHATLILRGMGMVENDRLEIYLNGHLIPDEAIGCILPSDAQPTSKEDLTEKKAKSAYRVFLSGAGTIFALSMVQRPSTRWFALRDAMVVYGQNALSIVLVESDAKA